MEKTCETCVYEYVCDWTPAEEKDCCENWRNENGKKVRCSECEYRNEWAVPWRVDKNNIDYAERCLRIAKHTFVCEHSMKTKQRDQEQYCKYFSRETEENKTLKDVQAKRNVESLEKMIEEFKKGERSGGMSEEILKEIEAALKKMYLDVANNYDVSDLHTDSDKVACVASRCRSVAVELIREIFHNHKTDGWIPVEERLPEDGTYLCTLKGELCGIEEPFTGMCGMENGIWDEDDCVIAWQQLPEPYKGV